MAGQWPHHMLKSTVWKSRAICKQLFSELFSITESSPSSVLLLVIPVPMLESPGCCSTARHCFSLLPEGTATVLGSTLLSAQLSPDISTMSGHAVVMVWYRCSVLQGCIQAVEKDAAATLKVAKLLAPQTPALVCSAQRDLLGPVLLKIRREER